MGVLVLRADRSAGLDSSEDEQSCYKYQWLKDFARARGVSLNKLVEEWVTVALAQLDGENHYRLRAIHGRSEVGLALVDTLDRILRRRWARKKVTG
jgi:hypothetical protein